jgi:YVTN family beta-propeller protein
MPSGAPRNQYARPRPILARTGLLLSCLGGLTCGRTNSPTGSGPCVNPAISLLSDSVVLLQGGIQQQSAVVTCGGTPSTGAAVVFAVSDTTTASVSITGLVSGRAGGRAVVTVTSPGVSRQFPVLVFGHPAGILGLSNPLSGLPTGVAVSSTGVVFVTRYDSASLGRYAGATLAATPGPLVPTTGLDVAFNPAGTRAFVTNRDQQEVTVVDVSSNSSIANPAVGGHPLRVLAHPTSGFVFVTTDQDSLYKLDFGGAILSRSFLPTSAIPGGPNGLALSPDGELLYVSHQIGQVTKVAVSSLAVLDTFSLGGTVAEAIAVSPTGDTLYVAQSSPDGVYLWNPTSHAFLSYVSLPAEPYDLKITPDSTQIYVTAGNRLFVIDRNGLVVSDTVNLSGGPSPARRIAFDRYGRFAVVADENGDVHLIR